MQVECFSIEFEDHVVGNCACRGCAKVPQHCPNPGCPGLVHQEQMADGDETGTWQWLEELCDVCGTEKENERTEDLAVLIEKWDARDRRMAAATEGYRRREHPTLAEAVADAAASYDSFFEWSRKQDWTDWKEGGPVTLGVDFDEDGNITPIERERYDHFGGFPLHGSYATRDGFDSATHLEVFLEYTRAMREASLGQLGPRAAAIAKFGGLAWFTPSDGEPVMKFGEDGEEPTDEYISWLALDEETISRRRIFQGYLMQIVDALDVSSVQSWYHTRWEILNAYRAQHWSQARDLFAYAGDRQFLPAAELAALQCHFEFLLTMGPIMDGRLGMGIENTPDYFDAVEIGLADLRSYMKVGLHPFSLHALQQPPSLLSPRKDGFVGDSHLYIALLQVPALELSAPVLWSERRKHLLNAAESLQSHVQVLGDSRFIYHGILAQSFELAGKLTNAIENWEHCFVTFIESDPKTHSLCPDLIPAALHTAKLYGVSGKSSKALPMLHRMLSLYPESASICAALARIYLDGGELRPAVEFANKTKNLEPMHENDPVLSLLIRFGNFEVDLEGTRKAAENWKPFSLLTEEVQKNWLLAAYLETQSTTANAERAELNNLAALCYSKAAELQLAHIFSTFRAEEVGVEGKDGNSLLMLGIKDPFFEYLQGVAQLSMGQMIKCIYQAEGGKTIHHKNFVRFLDRYARPLRDVRILKVLEELKDIGNTCRHSNPAEELHKRAFVSAKKVLEAIHL